MTSFPTLKAIIESFAVRYVNTTNNTNKERNTNFCSKSLPSIFVSLKNTGHTTKKLPNVIPNMTISGFLTMLFKTTPNNRITKNLIATNILVGEYSMLERISLVVK